MNQEQSAGASRRSAFLLTLTALIWGTAFVAQSTGGSLAGPYTFNCIRFLIGGIVLLPVIRLSGRLDPAEKKTAESRPAERKAAGSQRKLLLAGGAACGGVLAAASNLQQMGIYLGSPAGKAGFLTACYILFVPLLGLFVHKKCGWNIWTGMAAAAAGLYLLCMHGDFSIRFSDLLLILCALLFAMHILVIDYFTPWVDGVGMSCIQFFVCGALTAVPMFLVDMKHSAAGISAWAAALSNPDPWIPILYAGVLSSGAGYTLQIIGQRGIHPAAASLIMSLESVFSVLAGWLLLGEVLSVRETAGCVLIFGAVILAQLPVPEKK